MRNVIRRLYFYLSLSKHKLFNSSLSVGKGSSITMDAKIKSGGRISIGERVDIRNGALIMPNRGYINIHDDCSVGAYSVLEGMGGLTIKDNVRIAPHVCIYSSNHKYRDKKTIIRDQGMVYGQTIINRDVWIGTNCVILPEVVIGEGAVIAAGAVVTKNVKPFTVVAGIPAKEISQRR